MGICHTKPKINPSQNNRLFIHLKNKTLSLMSIIFPEDLDILEQIKYKKLKVCISKINISKQKIEGKTINLTLGENDCLIKLNNSQIVTSNYSYIYLWDLYSGKCIKSLDSLDTSNLIKINKTQILYSKYYGDIQLYDLSSECVKTFKVEDTFHNSSLVKLNKTQFARGYDGIISTWDMLSETCIKIIKAHKTSVNILLKLNLSEIASAGTSVKIWDYNTMTNVRTLNHINSGPLSSISKLDNSRIICIYDLHLILFWDFKSGQCLRKIDDYSSKEINYIFKSYSRILAVGHEKLTGKVDGILCVDNFLIEIWDLGTKKLFKTYTRHAKLFIKVLKINKNQIACLTYKSIRILDLYDLY